MKFIIRFSKIFAIFLLVYANAIFAEKTVHIYAFRNFRLAKPEKMILVGEIQSKTKEPILNSKEELGEYDMRPDRITVKIFTRKGLRRGQKLYVIDKNPYHDLFRDGHIVGEAEVISIFYSSFYGSWALSARGRLLRIRKGQFVARGQETEGLELAYESKRRGDHYAALGKYEEAIASYRQALDADISLAEAHAGLAQIYSQNRREYSKIESAAVEVLNSYEKAWQHRKNFHYQHEKLAFYHDYIEALEREYKHSYRLRSRKSGPSAQTQSLKYLDRIIEVAEAAVTLEKPISKYNKAEKNFSLKSGTALAQAHYYRMLYYLPQSNSNERKEYDYSQREADKWLKKILNLDQKNARSLGVAILFYYHRYQVLNTRNPNDRQIRSKLRKLILEQLGPYYKLYLNPKKEKYDPAIISILNRISK